MNNITKSIGLACLLISFTASFGYSASDEEIAKASQNPVADIVSLPLKNKFNFGAGDEDAFSYVLEAQPVYPISLSSLNLINRFIIPIVYQEAPYAGLDNEFGLGNITYQAFFSPADSGTFTWGLGPTITMPTHTEDTLGNDKWAAGPAVLGLIKSGPWVSGFLAQHFWDFAGDDDAADVNLSTLQYFINYNTPNYYINTSPTMSYNWEAGSGDEWVVPLGAGIGKVFRFGKMPVDMRISAYWNAEAPESAADWFTEFTIKFIFPK